MVKELTINELYTLDETIAKDHEPDAGSAHGSQLVAHLGGRRAYRHRRIHRNACASGGEDARGYCENHFCANNFGAKAEGSAAF